MARANSRDADVLDVRGAAALVRRHPETVRRWVWSGRLVAQRQGNRLLVARADVQAIAALDGRAQESLTAWADRAREAREGAGARASGSSAAEFVIEDRAERQRAAEARAGR